MLYNRPVRVSTSSAKVLYAAKNCILSSQSYGHNSTRGIVVSSMHGDFVWYRIYPIARHVLALQFASVLL